MNQDAWNLEYVIGHDHIDHHHEELFQLTSMLNFAIERNDRHALNPIIEFLEHYVVDHFAEEETLMQSHNFSGYEEHRREHSVFQAQVSQIRLMYDRNRHTTHVVYNIRKFLDSLIYHIRTIDIKMSTLTEEREEK